MFQVLLAGPYAYYWAGGEAVDDQFWLTFPPNFADTHARLVTGVSGVPLLVGTAMPSSLDIRFVCEKARKLDSDG